jgi:hypothetical protein
MIPLSLIIQIWETATETVSGILIQDQSMDLGPDAGDDVRRMIYAGGDSTTAS